MKSAFLSYFLLSLCFLASAFSEDSLDGEKIFEKVKEKYSNCKTFECSGTHEHKSPDLMSSGYTSSFLIRFSRPDKIRIDWEKGIFSEQGGESIYTSDGKIYSTDDTYSSFKTIEDAISTNAGVSNGISYFIPNLLLGKVGYLSYWTITREKDAAVDSKECYVIKIESKGYGIFTLNVNKADFSILSSVKVMDSKVATAQRVRANQENPKWFAEGQEVSGSNTVKTHFAHIKFDIPLSEVDFKAEQVTEKSGAKKTKRNDHTFYMKWVMPSFLLVMACYFFVVSLSPLLSKKPLVMSMHWNLALMCVGFLPSILNPFILGMSKGFDLMQWISPAMMIFILLFMKKQMQGYLVFAVSEEYFREALLKSISNLGYTTEETMGGIKIKETGETLKVMIQGMTGTAQIKSEKEITPKITQLIVSGMRDYFSKNPGNLNKISAYFYLGLGVFMLLMTAYLFKLFGKVV